MPSFPLLCHTLPESLPSCLPANMHPSSFHQIFCSHAKLAQKDLTIESLSGEHGLSSVLLQQETAPDGLLRLDKTPDGLQRIGQDIIGGRVTVIRQPAQEAQRMQVISLRLGTDRLMCPIGKFEDTSLWALYPPGCTQAQTGAVPVPQARWEGRFLRAFHRCATRLGSFSGWDQSHALAYVPPFQRLGRHPLGYTVRVRRLLFRRQYPAAGRAGRYDHAGGGHLHHPRVVHLRMAKRAAIGRAGRESPTWITGSVLTSGSSRCSNTHQVTTQPTFSALDKRH